jgi:hypothetical protein
MQLGFVNRSQSRSRLFAAAPMAIAVVLFALVAPAKADRGPDLDTAELEKLEVEAGNPLVFHAYAAGVQIYKWNGTSWAFAGPEAVLFADADAKSVVGIHYATPNGPAWESISGSKVIASALERVLVDPASIPWLKLGAVTSTGPGIFDGVSFIQRVHTVGGNAPSAPGTFVGQEARVPYTAEYYFYKGLP